MKRRNFKGKHREPASGRKLIIGVVVLTSTLSFTLGYFVGKAGIKEKQPEPQIIAGPSYHDPVPVSEVQTVQNSGQPIDDNPVRLEKSVKEEKHIEKDKLVEVSLAKKEIDIPGARERKPITKEDKPIQNEIYTVQVGAFKNSKDAAVLKRKLENKGYKVYIKKSEETKDIRLFKVRTGEFVNKEKAEVVALKIKKTEKLNAFVTSKDEKVDEEQKSSVPSHTSKQEKTR
ncbi:MAG: SPOR domain-containing protein [Nitrospirae bacterium]|nr:SPOR domain-containing protein [Nitrospirota bacterium]